jgi:hypothetical protein
MEDDEIYQRILDLAADGSATEGIRQGLDDLRQSRTRPAQEVLDDIRRDYGIGHART